MTEERRDIEIALLVLMMFVPKVREEIVVADYFIIDDLRTAAYQVQRGQIPDLYAHLCKEGEKFSDALPRVARQTALHGIRAKAAKLYASGMMPSREQRQKIIDHFKEMETADV